MGRMFGCKNKSCNFNTVTLLLGGGLLIVGVAGCERVRWGEMGEKGKRGGAVKSW